MFFESTGRKAQNGFIRVDGQTLHVAVRPGDKSTVPLLIFNGIGANLELLEPFVDALEGIETICYDVPGVGASPTPLLPYRFSGHARIAAHLLNALDAPVVDVIGVSWGGALAQQFAHQYPRRCRRLILAATSPGAVMVPGKPKVLMKMASPKRYTNPNYLKEIASTIYGGKFRSDPELARKHGSKIRSQGGKGYYFQLFAGAGWTSIHWLRKLKQPTLVLAGTDDPLIPLINAKALAALIPKSKLVTFDCGHLFLITHKEEMAKVISEFLTEHDPLGEFTTEEITDEEIAGIAETA
ncbi:MAG: poly(3-hydroxyalkanoate) depolymerase [Rhodospirillales bacterium]|nr:poly(3-hydroxyalkanoate) depolymerase [Rhodospirillales bacterium]